MKKLITICLMMAMGFASNAQQLSDYYDAVSDGRSGFSYTITVRIQKKSDNTYTATLLQVTPDSKGYYDALSGKLYTCSQLGNDCQPNNFGRLSITIRYESNGQEQVAGVFSFTGVNETVPLGMAITKGAIDGKPSDASNFKLELMGGTITVSQTAEISDKISKLNNVTSSPSSNNNSSTNLPQETSEQTTSSYTKQEITNQVVAGVAGLAGELINDWNANYDKKMARLQAESDARFSRSVAREVARFEYYYNPLINLANSGDENTQMILYLESDNFLNYKVPLREEWFKKALENKNPIALLTKANQNGYESNKEILHKLADTGNVDAMVMLGLWYGQKDKLATFYKSSIYNGNDQGRMIGGENEELALKYLTMAAENGSPNGMYHLAMIYKYGTTVPRNSYMSKVYKYGKSIPESSYMIKFNVEKNEKLAYDWLVKSIVPDYKESDYQYHHVRNLYWEGSHFESGSYYELARFYEEGKIIPKDETKASELRKLGRKVDEYLLDLRGDK